MQVQLPVLKFLAVDDLIIHERHDDQRTRPLILRIRNSGVFRNPPIVSPLLDGTDRYMVLDGANRVTALKEMDIPHIIAQVVQPDDPGLVLKTWNHVVWGLDPGHFIDRLRKIPDLHLTRSIDNEPAPMLEGDCGLALVKTCKGRTYAACTKAEDLEKRVFLLNSLVDRYREHAHLDRTSVREIQTLVSIYPYLSGLIIFPQFTIQDLLRLASQGQLLPTGITRFSISPRALHLDYPLQALYEDRPLADKNADLNRWIQDRVTHRGIRFYTETTILFDE
jgi:L-serine kinase (ATP) / ParB family transcriptional regulator, heme-responsive regulator